MNMNIKMVGNIIEKGSTSWEYKSYVFYVVLLYFDSRVDCKEAMRDSKEYKIHVFLLPFDSRQATAALKRTLSSTNRMLYNGN